MTVYQSNLVTSVLIVRIPTEGIENFRAYEDAVLPLLPEFNGRLERRLRNQDGTIEIHIVSFASDADRQNYRNDPRRMAQAWLLEKSSDVERLLTAQSGYHDRGDAGAFLGVKRTQRPQRRVSSSGRLANSPRSAVPHPA